MAVGGSSRSNKANMTVLAKKRRRSRCRRLREPGGRTDALSRNGAERLVGIRDRSMADDFCPTILSAVRARLPKCLRKTVEVFRAKVRYGRVADALVGPLDDIVAGDRLPLRHIDACGGDRRQA